MYIKCSLKTKSIFSNSLLNYKCKHWSVPHIIDAAVHFVILIPHFPLFKIMIYVYFLYRERRNSERERILSIPGMNERNVQDREKLFHSELLRPSRSRSRSRSPLQNGRVGSAKSSDSGFNSRMDERSVLKIKEERREEDQLHVHSHSNDRDKLRANELRANELFGPAPPAASHSMLERSSLFAPGPSMFLSNDRVPHHPALYGQFDKASPLDINHHRLQLQQDMEREHVRMQMSRMQPPPGALHFEHARNREQEMLLQDERYRREYLERLYDKDRFAALEHQSRLAAGLRTAELASMGSHFSRTMSPLINSLGVKNGSPAHAPPPLIPSSSATSRSHSNSPAVRKTKLHGSVESVGEKRETFTNSSTPDSHSR